MRSSTFITVLCAGLSVASPIIRKSLYVEVVTATAYVFVTQDADGSTIAPSDSSTSSTTVSTTSTSVEVTTSSSTTSSTTSTTSTTSSTPPPPPPTTTSTPPPPPPTTEAPPPPPSTTEAPPAPAVTEAPSAVEVTSDTPVAAPTYAPVQPADPNAGLPSGTDFASTVLMHHNAHRRNHSASDVTYDNTMAQYAQTVANSCHYAHDLTPGHGGYGQNIAAYGTSSGASSISDSKIVAQAISDLWYNGELAAFSPFYGMDNPISDFENWGHFSQIVWQSTTGVGCASKLCPSDPTFFGGMPWWFTVCNYSPPGNMGGAYGQNIKSPLGHPTLTS